MRTALKWELLYKNIAMMRFKRVWVVLLLLVTLATVLVTAKIKSQSSPPISLSPPESNIPASLFGMHIHHALKAWPNVPFYSWRLWDSYTTWGDLEPQPGAWNFKLLDHYVDLASTKKVELLLTLGQTPRWASARPNDESPYGNPGWPAEPANLEDWRHYIRTVATRYKGKIRYYEIWNEPDLKQFYTGSVEMLVALSKDAYMTLKQVDPSITVVSPGFTDATPALSWQKAFFRLGGGNYADIIAQHFYPQTAVPEDLVKFIHQVKEMLAAYGLTHKPLWNTEAGWLKASPIESDRKAMAYVARTYLMNWAAGVQRFYWYAWDNQDAVALHLTEPDGKTPTPAAESYAQLQTWLVGAQMKQCGSKTNGNWICQFSRQKQRFWIVWNPEREMTFAIPQDWNIQTIQALSGETKALTSSHAIAVDDSPVLLSATTPP